MATVSDADISDKEVAMTSQGFVTGLDRLWVPEHGWADDEVDAFIPPFRPQYLAAMHVFLHFFGTAQRVWVHLAAEMQAGKTGVMTALIRLMLNITNFHRINIRHESIFICTGMSDNDWRKQTCIRLPRMLRDNVYHNRGLATLAGKLRRKAAGPAGLSNVLVVIDESHLAMSATNRPSQLIFDTMRELCPVDMWASRNIRLLTISATDPASVLAAGAMRDMAEMVPLRKEEGYQSIERLVSEERIQQTFDLNDYPAVKKLTSIIESRYGRTANLYHILRPRPSQVGTIEASLRTLMPHCIIRHWNSKTKGAVDASSVSSDEEDINSILREEPAAPTFILIKNMFYAAKTLDDRYVGVMYDRITTKDDTTLQSLAGRACGYGKSRRTLIFTNMGTIKNYLSIWSNLTSRSGHVVEAAAHTLDGKMPGVKAVRVDAATATLHISDFRALPFRPSGGAAAGGGGVFDAPEAAAPSASNQASETGLEEFDSMDALRARWVALYTEKKNAPPTTTPRTPRKNDAGQFVCSIGETSIKQKAEDIRRFAVGTRGWGSGITTAAVGDMIQRVYVGYENGEPVFFLRWAIVKRS